MELSSQENEFALAREMIEKERREASSLIGVSIWELKCGENLNWVEEGEGRYK